jgi:acetyltransferase-like isoleucine patch superfamily enzyme
MNGKKTEVGVYKGRGVRVFPNVTLGKGVFLDDHVAVGYPNEDEFSRFLTDFRSGFKVRLEEYVKAPTVIGDNSIIRSGTTICSGTRIGPNLDCDHGVFIGGKNVVGSDATILYRAMIYHGNRIGNDVIISGFVCNLCEIGNGVSMFGYLVHKYDVIGGIPIPDDRLPEPSPIIRDGATVGMLALVIGKVVVGENAYVAAGAVVKRDVKSGTLVAGNPAKFIRKWTKTDA